MNSIVWYDAIKDEIFLNSELDALFFSLQLRSGFFSFYFPHIDIVGHL